MSSIVQEGTDHGRKALGEDRARHSAHVPETPLKPLTLQLMQPLTCFLPAKGNATPILLWLCRGGAGRNGLYELLYELLLKAMRSAPWLHDHCGLIFNNLHFLIRTASPCNSAVNRRVVGSNPT